MKASKNRLEWIVFAVSAAIFATIVGVLLFDAMEGGARAPQIEVETGAPQQERGMWSVPLVIRNLGDETAEQVRVEVAVVNEGRDLEVTEVTVAFVPRNSYREAWALFRADPRGRDIVPRAISFKRP
jgi:uncharacterized protein (TIGR02588 family)